MVAPIVTAVLETSPPPLKHPMALGTACGAGAALCWALGFVAARHGVDIGMSPLILALHRYVWPGLILLPFLAAKGFGDLAGVGWGRGIVLTAFGGLPLALWSYLGYLFVPLGHGGIIQPSCAAITGLILAYVVLREPLPTRRIVGAAIMLAGLCVIGFEASRTIGMHGVGGDLLFVAAGVSFGIFGMLLQLWQVNALQAAAITSVLSLVGLPILYFNFDNFWSAGLYENLLQAVIQGLVAGATAIYLFTRAVVLLGASRASVFPSLVPPFVFLVGLLALGVVPSAPQLIGLVVVLFGFRLTQRG
jgi:drug/metabolite transporter (DMT)-like permease